MGSYLSRLVFLSICILFQQIRSGILFLKAKCEIYLGRRQTAADTLIEAVKCDPMSFESLEAIIDMHLTSKGKTQTFLTNDWTVAVRKV